jgi:hypothetical protein
MDYSIKNTLPNEHCFLKRNYSGESKYPAVKALLAQVRYMVAR